MRKLEVDTLKKVGFMIFNTREELKEYLEDNPQFKEYLGWLLKKDEKLLGRNIAPSYLSDGRVFFYIIYNPKLEMKYKNIYLGDAIDNVYNKKTKVYGLDTLDYTKDEVYVVEGVFDRIRLVEEGYNVISLLGTSVTPYQLKILKRFKEVNLCVDSDEGGEISLMNAKRQLIQGNHKGVIRERLPNFGSGDDNVKDVDDLFKLGYNEIKFK